MDKLGLAETQVPFAKGTAAAMLFGALVFCAIGVWLLVRAVSASGIEGLFLVIFGGAAIFFFGPIAVHLVRNMQAKKAALVLTKDGFFDNSGPLSIGFIPWTDVEGIGESSYRGHQFVAIKFKEANSLFQRQNFVRRLAMHINSLFFGAPIHISTTALQMDFIQLKDQFHQYFTNYQSSDNGRLK